MPRFLALAAVALVAAAALSPAPVHAEATGGKDAAADVTGVPYVDARLVQVKHTSKAVRVRMTSLATERHTRVSQVDLDIDPKRPGPEVRLVSDANHWAAQPMRRWKIDRRKRVQAAWEPGYYGDPVGRCGRLVDSFYFENDAVEVSGYTVTKKRGCFAGARVRVHWSTTTTDYYAPDQDVSAPWPASMIDRLPGKFRQFTPWQRVKPARSKSRTFRDGRDPVRAWADISRVDAGYSPTGLHVLVQHGKRPEGRLGGVGAFVDTNTDGVPDWEIATTDSGDEVYVLQKSSWDDYGTPVACATSSDLAGTGERSAWFSVPASCLGAPASLRVAVLNRDVSFGTYRPLDWWGGTGKWSAELIQS